MFGTFLTFGTPVTFGTVTLVTVFSALGIISSEFWYIWYSLVHVTFGTSVGTLTWSGIIAIILSLKPAYGSCVAPTAIIVAHLCDLNPLALKLQVEIWRKPREWTFWPRLPIRPPIHYGVYLDSLCPFTDVAFNINYAIIQTFRLGNFCLSPKTCFWCFSNIQGHTAQNSRDKIFDPPSFLSTLDSLSFGVK